MRIEVKGRNLPVSEDLREHVAKRFRKVERQVSEFAELEVEVFEERNPAIADNQVAEATLHLKGVTLRARDASPDIVHSISLCADALHIQVKRHRDKRRRRREQRAAAAQNVPAGAVPVEEETAATVGDGGVSSAA
ncbi:MAG: ribosome hibernation-promoting factor, HPF/YfiA family [Solirubrobacteraceae bacterium]